MPSNVEVRKVESDADFKAFFEFPWQVYKDDPHWVPPLLSMRRDLLDKKKNPGWEYMEGDYFAAWRGDKIVGTIAAFINHRHNEFHEEHIGWFGAFEVYNDQEAATALLQTAETWVRERGYDAIRGPQTFTTHDECGLLIDGFVRPVLLMPYNYPYYQPLVENAGFEKVMDVYSFHLTPAIDAGQELSARLSKLTEAVKQRHNISIRPIDRHNIKAEFQLFKELYNAAWEKNWGFTPMTPRELDAMVESLGQFFDPDFAFFAEVNGDPAGFIMGVPDFNQVLQKANARPGTPEFITLIRAFWHWKINPVIRWLRVPLMGVKEQYRKTGVASCLYMEILQTALKNPKVQNADGGWILETNQQMVSIANSLGGNIYKTHRFYEKKL